MVPVATERSNHSLPSQARHAAGIFCRWTSLYDTRAVCNSSSRCKFALFFFILFYNLKSYSIFTLKLYLFFNKRNSAAFLFLSLSLNSVFVCFFFFALIILFYESIFLTRICSRLCACLYLKKNLPLPSSIMLLNVYKFINFFFILFVINSKL